MVRVAKRNERNVKMDMTTQEWYRSLMIDLAQVVENLQIHHSQRDGDWLKPQDLRLILRLMYHLHIGIGAVIYDKST